MRLYCLFSASLLLLIAAPALADEPAANHQPGPLAKPEISAEQEKQFKLFEETLTGAKFRGHFTVSGKEGPPKEETYIIKSVKKLPSEDFWLFQATVKYGDKEVTLPMPLRVKWAGSTPVITLDNVTIPTLGTFSSRVVIDGDRYAGTWQHDKVGGHLFGSIEKETPDDKAKPVE